MTPLGYSRGAPIVVPRREESHLSESSQGERMRRLASYGAVTGGEAASPPADLSFVQESALADAAEEDGRPAAAGDGAAARASHPRRSHSTSDASDRSARSERSAERMRLLASPQ
jgi:hypothetical protein